MPANTLSLSPKSLLLSNPVIIDQIGDARARLLDYEAIRLTHHELTHPADTASEVRYQLAHAKLSDIPALRQKLATLTDMSAKVVEINARAQVGAAFAPAKAAISTLLATSIGLLKETHTEALAAEAAFFAQYGQPTQRTSVSGRFAEAIGTLTAIKTGWDTEQPNHGQIPQVESSPLSQYYGIAILE